MIDSIVIDDLMQLKSVGDETVVKKVIVVNDHFSKEAWFDLLRRGVNFLMLFSTGEKDF